jgi:hypothetical protein
MNESTMTIEITKRTLGAAPGALYAKFAVEYQRMLDASKGDRVEAAKLGIRRLYEGQLIAAHDVAPLDSMCSAILTAARDHTPNRQQVFEHVRSVQESMVDASDVARAIVGVALDSLAPHPQAQIDTAAKSNAAAKSNTVDAAILGGVLGGAVVGGAIGGVGGAIIGAVVGGIGAGIAAACA